MAVDRGAPETIAEPGAEDEIQRILDRFRRYHPQRIDLSLDRMHRLLSDLGDPHLALPPVIHIAGTNGKGSVAAFLAAGLEISDKTVSAYTSPHILRFAERYHVAGQDLSDGELLDLFREVEQRNDGKPATEFEITTAAAFLAMARTPADVAILETGLGGRLDATNVVPHPAATVITRIGYDHMDFLGSTLAAIAGEKAAIQKSGTPSIVAFQEQAAMDVVTEAAREIGALLFRAGLEWTVETDDSGGGTYRRADVVWPLPPPGLPGRHQLENAAAAVACLEICGFPGVTRDAVSIGIRNVTWPGRMEWVQRGPLPAMLPQGWELWLDAAHNPLGAQAVAETLRNTSERDPRPIHLVFSLLADKDLDGFLEPFAGLVSTATAVSLTGEARARPAEEMVARARAAGIDAHAANSIEEALAGIGAHDPAPSRVLLAGSHLLLAAALKANAQDGTLWLDRLDGAHYCAH
ncbi:MAG: bifunctional folylpolyglutamate synthase/dihydrofolate synthase [Alphaproteobacteria bacterium]|nr:bifunctional folylpolyglutamate synthase/dihydrofolate synthase [Alphaproteobacteria bacterium]